MHGMLKSYKVLYDFTICGFQDITLNDRGDFRILNTAGAPKDYEHYSRLSIVSPEDECEPIMTRATIQLI